MKSIFYLLFITMLIISSCNSDAKKASNNETQNKNSVVKTEDGPKFTMVDKVTSSIKVTDADTIDVNTIEEIVTNANHNTALRLKKGTYTLDKNFVYYISSDKKEIINKNEVQTRSMGGQIFISGMTNFSIIGEGSKIFSNNPKAPPIFILNSNEGIFKNLILGHKISKRTSSNVPSLYVARSNKVNFNNCNLGNSSRMGLKIQNSKYLTFTNCEVNNSKEKIIELIQAKSITFANSTFNNNVCVRGCFDFLGNENSVEFKNAMISNNISKTQKSTHLKHIITGPSKNIRFRNSTFRNNKSFEKIGIDDFNLTECQVQSF